MISITLKYSFDVVPTVDEDGEFNCIYVENIINEPTETQFTAIITKKDITDRFRYYLKNNINPGTIKSCLDSLIEDRMNLILNQLNYRTLSIHESVLLNNEAKFKADQIIDQLLKRVVLEV